MDLDLPRTYQIMVHYDAFTAEPRYLATMVFISTLDYTRCVIVTEIGKDGTPHYQGIVELKDILDKSEWEDLRDRYRDQLGLTGKHNEFSFSRARKKNLDDYIAKDVSDNSIKFIYGIDRALFKSLKGNWIDYKKDKCFSRKVIATVYQQYLDHQQHEEEHGMFNHLESNEETFKFVVKRIFKMCDLESKPWGTKLASDLANAIMYRIGDWQFISDSVYKVVAYNNRL